MVVEVKGWVYVAAIAALCACQKTPTPSGSALGPATHGIPPQYTQLVTVITPDWGAFAGELRRFERDGEGSWKPVGDKVPVVIGRNGYGWGRGVHGDGKPEPGPGPIKREGDGRSPAGLFELGEAYGYSAQQNEISLEYTQATSTLRCVDDPKSRHYNRIVSTSETVADWKSAEHMRRADDLYALTIVVEHNTGATEPGAGSCIFLHLWAGPEHGMSGCTAMSIDALLPLARWLDPGRGLLVALPREAYDAVREGWQLP